MDDLDILASKIKTCELCPLSKNRTHAVPGEGPNKTKIVIIGEAPGQMEDEQSRPFVGRSGQLLTRTLEEVGIPRKRVFITNICKCRPPNNRNPTPDEMSICSSNYLFKQIDAINPETIVLLGNIALEGVLGLKGITKYRGKFIERNGRNYLPTFHPSAALRFIRNAEALRKDLALLTQPKPPKQAKISDLLGTKELEVSPDVETETKKRGTGRPTAWRF